MRRHLQSASGTAPEQMLLAVQAQQGNQYVQQLLRPGSATVPEPRVSIRTAPQPTIQRACAGECKTCCDDEEDRVVRKKEDPALERSGDPTGGSIALGTPGDAFEQEADAIADRIVGGGGGSATPAPLAVRASASSAPSAPSLSTTSYVQGLHGGAPLSNATRTYFEGRLHHSLEHVRVHTDSDAGEAARALGAKAFTYKNHIAFGAGRYEPDTDRGRHLLAHEIVHVLQQPGHLAMKPETDPKADKDKTECRTGIQPGSGKSMPELKNWGPGGAYYIWGPPYGSETPHAYSHLSISAWIPWRFGKLSSAVTTRILAEADAKTWNWTAGVPPKGCQVANWMPMSLVEHFVMLANRDPAARNAEKKETGLAKLPEGEIVDEEIVVVATRTGPTPQGGSPPSDADKDKPKDKTLTPVEQAERMLDPTSAYLGGEAGSNAPPYPARMDGPELEVPNGIGTFSMNLDYAAVAKEAILELAYRMSGSQFTWELFDINDIVKRGLGAKAQSDARRWEVNAQAKSAAGGATLQRAKNDIEELSDETVRSWEGLRDPLAAAQGGSAVDVITRLWANELNLALLPASAIIAAGGFLVHLLADLFSLDDHHEQELSFPKKEGFYMVRCIATPRPRGPNNSVIRASSVRTKIVEVRSPDYLARNALGTADLGIARLQVERALTSDAAEIKRIDEEIASLQEQQGGDVLLYLDHLIQAKEQEKKDAPEWRKSKIDDELETLKRRRAHAEDKREGTLPTHYRPQAAFTSKVTGDTYLLLLEMSEVATKSGAKVRIMDLTMPDGKSFEMWGPTREQAVKNTVKDLAYHNDLGVGRLLVRMPANWSGGPQEIGQDTGYADTSLVKKRLQDLATALLVLSIVVPGVGEVSAVLTAGLAVERLISRGLNGTLRLDTETISDSLAILGAVAQGAALVGKLRIARSGDAFVAALKEGDQVALKAAAETLDAAMKAKKVLDATSTVVNVGGLLWGDALALKQLAQIEQDELDGKLTHSEAGRRRADLLASAIRDHGIMLAGALKPHGADRASGTEPTAKDSPVPHDPTAPARSNETIAEPELERRSNEAKPADPQAAKPTDGVRARFRTPDNLHEIFVLNDGRIFRCSLTCAQLRTWYGGYLTSQPEGTRRNAATELDGLLATLEGRAANGENTQALNDAIAVLDMRMRDFIAPDLTADVQRGLEARSIVKKGEVGLTRAQVRNLLRAFNLDEINALAGEEGLRGLDALRRLADSSPELLQKFRESMARFELSATDLARAFERFHGPHSPDTALAAVLAKFGSKADTVTLRNLLTDLAGSGESATKAADFLGHVSRIFEVDGVKFDLTDLHDAYARGDAVLDHGPLQDAELLADMAGGDVAFDDGRVDFGKKEGGLTKRFYKSPIIDWVILETNGTYKLVLGKNHSGLSGGRAFVFGAGEFIVNPATGIVLEVTNRSGHYLPSEENLMRAIRFMYDRGLLSPLRPPKIHVVK